MYLLVPAYPGCPGQTAVKWLLLLFSILFQKRTNGDNGTSFYGLDILVIANKWHQKTFKNTRH